MPSHTIRTFFAIELPAHTSKQIETIINDLKKSIHHKIKWAATNSMHITLKFIGEFKLKHKDSLLRNLQSRIHGSGKIELSFSRIGGFPNLRNPRVVWLGLNYPDQLSRLAQTIDSIASDHDYPKEKRNFSPHLTLGRIRRNITTREREQIGQIIGNYRHAKIESFNIDRLCFIRSTLSPKGPIYSTLFEISL
jgi:2'-5' RNA ligase